MIKKYEGTEWRVKYRGISGTIKRWYRFTNEEFAKYNEKGSSYSLKNNPIWNYYIFINLTLNPELKDSLTSYLTDKDAYYWGNDILNNIEFHGGCTFYEYRANNHVELIEAGCDYNHSFDEGKTYTEEGVYRDFKVTVDALAIKCPNLVVYNLKGDTVKISELFE